MQSLLTCQEKTSTHWSDENTQIRLWIWKSMMFGALIPHKCLETLSIKNWTFFFACTFLIAPLSPSSWSSDSKAPDGVCYSFPVADHNHGMNMDGGASLMLNYWCSVVWQDCSHMTTLKYIVCVVCIGLVWDIVVFYQLRQHIRILWLKRPENRPLRNPTRDLCSHLQVDRDKVVPVSNLDAETCLKEAWLCSRLGQTMQEDLKL